MRTGLIYSERFLEHDTGPGHPERPDRLRAVIRQLERTGLLDGLVSLPFGPADQSVLERVHRREYIERVFASCAAGEHCLDGADTAISQASAHVAQLASGGAVAAVDAVMAATVGNAFCAMRPPGHHASASRASGFCLFNHAAIAAEHLIAQHGLERIAIVDFDVHHGDGTQHCFEHRRDVLFISIHEHPRYLYPGTGHDHEEGAGEGAGLTFNIPLLPGGDDHAYEQAMTLDVLPRLEEFSPQFLLLSAGFDAATSDSLSHMSVTPACFGRMTRELCDFARSCCGGRVVSILEGGYSLDELARGVCEHVRALCDSSAATESPAQQ